MGNIHSHADKVGCEQSTDALWLKLQFSELFNSNLQALEASLPSFPGTGVGDALKVEKLNQFQERLLLQYKALQSPKAYFDNYLDVAKNHNKIQTPFVPLLNKRDLAIGLEDFSDLFTPNENINEDSSLRHLRELVQTFQKGPVAVSQRLTRMKAIYRLYLAISRSDDKKSKPRTKVSESQVWSIVNNSTNPNAHAVEADPMQILVSSSILIGVSTVKSLIDCRSRECIHAIPNIIALLGNMFSDLLKHDNSSEKTAVSAEAKQIITNFSQSLSQASLSSPYNKVESTSSRPQLAACELTDASFSVCIFVIKAPTDLSQISMGILPKSSTKSTSLIGTIPGSFGISPAANSQSSFNIGLLHTGSILFFCGNLNEGWMEVTYNHSANRYKFTFEPMSFNETIFGITTTNGFSARIMQFSLSALKLFVTKPVSNRQIKCDVKCRNGHKFTAAYMKDIPSDYRKKHGDRASVRCDVCKTNVNNDYFPYFHCQPCSYDLCGRCYIDVLPQTAIRLSDDPNIASATFRLPKQSALAALQMNSCLFQSLEELVNFLRDCVEFSSEYEQLLQVHTTSVIVSESSTINRYRKAMSQSRSKETRNNNAIDLRDESLSLLLLIAVIRNSLSGILEVVDILLNESKPLKSRMLQYCISNLLDDQQLVTKFFSSDSATQASLIIFGVSNAHDNTQNLYPILDVLELEYLWNLVKAGLVEYENDSGSVNSVTKSIAGFALKIIYHNVLHATASLPKLKKASFLKFTLPGLLIDGPKDVIFMNDILNSMFKVIKYQKMDPKVDILGEYAVKFCSLRDLLMPSPAKQFATICSLIQSRESNTASMCEAELLTILMQDLDGNKLMELLRPDNADDSTDEMEFILVLVSLLEKRLLSVIVAVGNSEAFDGSSEISELFGNILRITETIVVQYFGFKITDIVQKSDKSAIKLIESLLNRLIHSCSLCLDSVLVSLDKANPDSIRSIFSKIDSNISQSHIGYLVSMCCYCFNLFNKDVLSPNLSSFELCFDVFNQVVRKLRDLKPRLAEYRRMEMLYCEVDCSNKVVDNAASIPQHQTVTTWKSNESNTSLEFSAGDTVCRRPGSTSCFPAATAAISEDVSVFNVVLTEGSSNTNWMTVGLARVGFQLSNSDGFGRTSRSWGIADDRSKSDCSVFAYNSSRVCECPRKLKTGDIITVIAHFSAGCVEITVNNGEFTHIFGNPPSQPFYKILAAKNNVTTVGKPTQSSEGPTGTPSSFCFGATFANDHVLTIKPVTLQSASLDTDSKQNKSWSEKLYTEIIEMESLWYNLSFRQVKETLNSTITSTSGSEELTSKEVLNSWIRNCIFKGGKMYSSDERPHLLEQLTSAPNGLDEGGVLVRVMKKHVMKDRGNESSSNHLVHAVCGALIWHLGLLNEAEVLVSFDGSNPSEKMLAAWNIAQTLRFEEPTKAPPSPQSDEKGLMPIPVFKINSLPLNEGFNNLDDLTLSCIRRARLLLEFTPIVEQKFNDNTTDPKIENSKRWSDIIIDFIKNGPEPDLIRDEITARNKKLQNFLEFLDDIHFNITTYTSLDNMTSALTHLQANNHFLQGYEGCDSSLQMSATEKWFDIISIALEKFKTIVTSPLDANIDTMNGAFPVAYSKKFFMNIVMNLLLLKYSECDIDELIRIDIASFLDCCCKSKIELVRRFSIQFTERLLMSLNVSKSSSHVLQMKLLNLLMNQISTIHNLVPRLEANRTDSGVSYTGVIECNPLEYGVTIPLSKLGSQAHSVSMSMWIWVDKVSQPGVVFTLGYPDFSSGKTLGPLSYFALKLRENGILHWEISDGDQQSSSSDTVKYFELSGNAVPTRKWFNVMLVMDANEGDAAIILDGFVIAKKAMKKPMIAAMKDGYFASSFVCFGQRKFPLAFAKGAASLDFNSAVCLVANPHITGKAISSRDIVETYSSTCKNFVEPNIVFDTEKRNFRFRNSQSTAKTFVLHSPSGKKISYTAQINANLSSIDSKFSFGLVTDNHYFPVDWFQYLGNSTGGHVNFGFTPSTAGFFHKNGILYFMGFSGEERPVGPFSNKATLRVTFNIATNEAVFSVESASENVTFNAPLQFVGSANSLCIRCGITLDSQDECEILSSSAQSDSETTQAVSPSIPSSSAVNVVNTGVIISSWTENRIEDNCRLTVANGGSSIFNNYGKNKSKVLECSAIIPFLSARSSLTVMVTRCVKLGDTLAFGIIRHKDNEGMIYTTMDYTNNFGRQQNTWGIFDERKDNSQNCSLSSSSEPDVSPASHQCLEEGDLVNITVDYTKSPALLYFTINGDLIRTMKVPIFRANAYEDYAFYLLVPLQHEFTIVPDGGLLRTFEPPGEFVVTVIPQVTEVTLSSLEIITNDVKYSTVDLGLLFNYQRCESLLFSSSNLYNTLGVLVRVLGQKHMSLLPQSDKFVDTCAKIWDIAFTCSLRSLRFAASNLLFEWIKNMESEQLYKLFESKMSCQDNMASLLTTLITNLGSQMNDFSTSSKTIETFGDSLGHQLRGLVRALCQRKDSNTEVIPVMLSLAYVATDSVERLIELQQCIVGGILNNKGLPTAVSGPTSEVLNSSSFAIGYLSLFSDILDVNATPGKVISHKSFNNSVADRHVIICDSYSRACMGAEEKYAVLIPCDLEEKLLEFEFATDKPLNPERKYPEYVPLSVINKNTSAKLDELIDYCMSVDCSSLMNLLHACLNCDTADIRPIQSQKKKNTVRKCLTFESTHPYLDNSEIFFKITIPRAKEMTISFDSRSRTENNYDYIKFYRDSGRNSTWGSEKYTGQTFPGVSSTPPLVITNDTVYFYFHSDGSNNDWGYKFTVTGDQQITDEDYIQEAYTELSVLRTLKLLATKTTSFLLKSHHESQSTKPGIITAKEPKAFDSFITNNWNGILRTFSVEKTLSSYFKFYNQLDQKSDGATDGLEGVDFSKVPSDNEFELNEILDVRHQFGCVEASESSHYPGTINSGTRVSDTIYSKILESFDQMESNAIDLSEVAETSIGSISKSLLTHMKNPNGFKKYSPSNIASYALSQSAQTVVETSSESINIRLICSLGTTHCRIRANPTLKSPEVGNIANGSIVAVTGVVNDFWRLADGSGFCIVKIDGVDWVSDDDEIEGWTGLMQSSQISKFTWKQRLNSIYMNKLSAALIASSYDLLSHMFTCWPNHTSFEASSCHIELLLRASGAHSDYVKGEQHFNQIAKQGKNSEAKVLEISPQQTSFRTALETLLVKSRQSENPAQFNNALVSVSKKVFGYIISKVTVQKDWESNEPVLEPVVMESAHQYENDTRLMQQLSIPGATGMEIVFDERSSTERNYDYVCFYGDSSKRQLIGVKYSGRRGSENNWPGVRDNSSLIINSDTCWVYFETDNSNTDWGWKLTAYPITATSNTVSVIRDLEFGESQFSLIDSNQRICLHLSPSAPTIGFGLEIYKLLLSSFENYLEFFDNEEVIYLLNLLSTSIDVLPSIDPFTVKRFLEVIAKTFMVYIQSSKSSNWSRLATYKCERITACIFKMGSKIINITSQILNNLAPTANDPKSSPSAIVTSFVEIAIFVVAYGLTKAQTSPKYKVDPSQYFVDSQVSLSFHGKGITCAGTSCTNYAFGQYFEHLIFPLTHMKTTHTVSRFMKVSSMDPNGKLCVGLSLIPMSSADHISSDFTSAKAMILLSPIRILLTSSSSAASESNHICISEGDIIGFNVSNNDKSEWNVSVSRNGIPCSVCDGVSTPESPFGTEFRGIPGFKHYVLVPFVAIECNLRTEVIFLDEAETPAFVTKNSTSLASLPIKSPTAEVEGLLFGLSMNDYFSNGNSDEDDEDEDDDEDCGVFDDDDDGDEVDEDEDDDDDDDDDDGDDDESDSESTEQVEIVPGKVQNVTSFDILGGDWLEALEDGKVRNPSNSGRRCSCAVRLERDCETIRVRVKIVQAEALQDRFSFGIAEESNFSMQITRFGRASKSWGLGLSEGNGLHYRIYNRNRAGRRVGHVTVGDVLGLTLNNRSGIAEFTVNNKVTHSISIPNRSRALIIGCSLCPDMTIQVLQDTAIAPSIAPTLTLESKADAMIMIGQDKLNLPQFMNTRKVSMSEDVTMSSRCNKLMQIYYDNFIGRYTLSKQSGDLHPSLNALNRTYQLLSHQDNDISSIPLSSLMEPTYIEDLLPNVMQECTQILRVTNTEQKLVQANVSVPGAISYAVKVLGSTTRREGSARVPIGFRINMTCSGHMSSKLKYSTYLACDSQGTVGDILCPQFMEWVLKDVKLQIGKTQVNNSQLLEAQYHSFILKTEDDAHYQVSDSIVRLVSRDDDRSLLGDIGTVVASNESEVVVIWNNGFQESIPHASIDSIAALWLRRPVQEDSAMRRSVDLVTTPFFSNNVSFTFEPVFEIGSEQHEQSGEWNIPIAIIPIISPEYIMESPQVEDRRIAMLDDHLLAINGCVFTEEIRNRTDLSRSDLRTIECRYAKKRLRQIDAAMVSFIDTQLSQQESEITSLSANWSNAAPTTMQGLAKFPMLMSLINDEIHRIMRTATMSSSVVTVNPADNKILKNRYAFVHQLNFYFKSAMMYINLENSFANESCKRDKFDISLSNVISNSRAMICSVVKMPTVKAMITGSEVSGSKFEVVVSRSRAMKHKLAGDVDREGQWSVFGQVFRAVHGKPPSTIRRANQLWDTLLAGERAQDAGGPYRESLSAICDDLQSSYLPLFKLSPNTHADSSLGLNGEYVINPDAQKSGTQMEMLCFVGKLMGTAIRSGNFLDICLSPLVWKLIVGDEVSLDDIATIDNTAYQMIQKYRQWKISGSSTLPDHLSFLTFTWSSLSGATVDLIPNGSHINLDVENIDSFCKLLEDFRLNEMRVVCRAIRVGIETVIPSAVLSLVSHSQLEEMVCGKSKISIPLLKSVADYSGCKADDNHIAWFWEVLENNFSNDDLRAFVRFAWGRSRLPLNAASFSHKFKIQNLSKSNPDLYLPESHTCFFTVDIPKYSSKEILLEKLLYAIYNCAAIDGDSSSARSATLAWES